MYIGFDFDDTVYRTMEEMDKVVLEHSKQEGIDFLCYPMHSDHKKRYNLDEGLLTQLWNKANRYDTSLLIPEAVEWLRGRQAKGDKLFCITSRYNDGTNEDISYNISCCLDRAGLHNVAVCSDVSNKGMVCKALGVEVLIDDLVENFAGDFLSYDVSAILVERLWNIRKKKPPYVNVLKSWSDADEVLGVIQEARGYKSAKKYQQWKRGIDE